ncbi:MAG: SRPBCC family protein [Gemmatimonadaceae bacterium]
MSAAVKREMLVNASRAHAFKVFTDDINRWWPREHHIGKSPLKRAVIEPQVSGRWYSICEDDSEIDVGRVQTWDPPNRVVMTWQINGSWQYDPNFVTIIDVAFEDVTPTQCRVLFEHRGLDAYGPASDAVRMMFEAPNGWGETLSHFQRLAEESAS